MKNLNLVAVSLLPLFLAGCGGDFARSKKTTITPQGGAVVTDLCPIGMSYNTTPSGISFCSAPINSCDSLCQSQPTMACPTGMMGTICTIPLQKTTPIPSTPAQNGGGVIYGANASVPSSYTMLDTPNANLCLDAFIRNGTPVPDTAVARTIRSFNTRNNGIALQDMASSTVPILNILELSSSLSNVVFQLLNPNGFYCIVRNQAQCSNVTIQRNCSAQVAQLEPSTTVTVNEPVKKHCWGWFCNKSYEGTTSSYNSSIIETPCIP